MNLAARLEQAAGVGEILLGEATFDLVRDAVSTEVTEPLTLKGLGRASCAYPTARGRSRRGRARAGGSTRPFVGRERETAMLRDTFDADARRPAMPAVSRCSARPASGNHGSPTSSCGGPANARRRCRGRCLAVRRRHHVLARRRGRDAGRRSRGGRHRRASHARRSPVRSSPEDDPVVARRVSQAIGMAEGGAAAPEETFWAVRTLLRGDSRSAGRSSLVFDDIHWGEPTFLELIEHIADWARDVADAAPLPGASGVPRGRTARGAAAS